MTSPVKVWRERRKRYRYWGKVGKLVSFTRIEEAPRGFEAMPYFVGMVRFDDGEQAVGQVVGVNGRLKKGMRLVGVIRKMRQAESEELITYGVKFKPVDGERYKR